MASISAKVLVADVPEMDERIADCLPGHDLTFVRSMAEAVGGLRRDGFQLVVIGLHFDESRMFELLQYVRAQERYAHVPIICIQGLEIILPESVRQNIDVAVRALGGTAFLDLREDSIQLHQHCDFLDRVAIETGKSVRPN
jgi:hypothetical protein